MIVLRGLSRGGRVPVDAFEGYVHSVFDTAVNILLRDGLLITLLAARHANQPRGVRVEVPHGFRFVDHLSTGQVVAYRGGMLRFAGAVLQIDLRGVSVWRASLHLVDRAQVGVALPVLREVLAQHPAGQQGIAGGSALALAAREPIRTLIEAARGCDWEGVYCCKDTWCASPLRPIGHLPRSLSLTGEENPIPWAIAPRKKHRISTPATEQQGAADTIGRLIGLGPGLTPAGDDFLIGFLAGLRITIRDAAREAFIASFSNEIARLSSHTNDISRAFLLDAARGEASECIIALVDSIQSGHTDSLRMAAESVLATGSTSGADMLFGFLSALDM